MTNLERNTVMTDDRNVYEETKKINSVKIPLEKIVTKSGNPHLQLFKDYISGEISIDELHRILRGKLLKNAYKMKKEEYPRKPTEESLVNMKGWAEACAHIKCVNAGNKYWLGMLLNDIVEGKLEAEQGQEEEVEELLSEWY